MSSEAARKAYPLDNHIAEMQRQAFDKGAQWGAVEALRRAAEKVDTALGSDADLCDCGNVRVNWEQIDRAFEWEEES